MSASAKLRAVAEACAEKQQFKEDILSATMVIVELSNREAEAAKSKDFAMLRTLRAELKVARQWKDSIVADYARHLLTHRC